MAERSKDVPLERAARVFVEALHPLDKHWYAYDAVWNYPLEERLPKTHPPGRDPADPRAPARRYPAGARRVAAAGALRRDSRSSGKHSRSRLEAVRARNATVAGRRGALSGRPPERAPGILATCHARLHSRTVRRHGGHAVARTGPPEARCGPGPR